MTSLHSPGPWDARLVDSGLGLWSVDSPALASLYCSVESGMGQRETAQANAMLIAAAPDALEVCERLVREFAEGGEVSMGVIEDARLAIRKAKEGSV